jgi:hypothetical protein
MDESPTSAQCSEILDCSEAEKEVPTAEAVRRGLYDLPVVWFAVLRQPAPLHLSKDQKKRAKFPADIGQLRASAMAKRCSGWSHGRQCGLVSYVGDTAAAEGRRPWHASDAFSFFDYDFCIILRWSCLA